ncbi:alkane oxidation protein activator PraB [Pseudomonas sp. MWU13-2100]|uniref:alkane oxidation protein activator PraB n=1 Tax=Pseudomonas sp. MWU13-2100 TaxID=2935075 RepID=UPI00200DC887|nr:alkane oxidation protein activator PraB [Pseudomonas sp. MWU13-2100]
MKGIKTLASFTAIAVCLGAASMVNAATITSPAAGSTFSAPGTITVSSPASGNIPVQCNITFSGTVASDSKTASITNATVSGSNFLCGIPVMQNLPWTLTPTSTTTATVSGVSFKILSNCGTANVLTNYAGGALTLSTTPQSVGTCKITQLSVSPNPTFVITNP